MLAYYPLWDISYAVSVTYAYSSVIGVVNGFFAFLPSLSPERYADLDERGYGEGISAFVSAVALMLAGLLLLLETVNETRTEQWGGALERVLGTTTHGPVEVRERGESGPGEERRDFSFFFLLLSRKQDGGSDRTRRQSRARLVPSPQITGQSFPSSADESAAFSLLLDDLFALHSREWECRLPSWVELRTRHIRDIGFLACITSLAGAFVFLVYGVTSLPPVGAMLDSGIQMDLLYWLPQAVASFLFILSGILYMLETQERWYVPATGVLGWHIGAWNVVGGIAFMLCAVYGFGRSESASTDYQVGFCNFWGSWAFMIGSLLQWYESLDKYPVKIQKGKTALRKAGS